MKIGIVCNSFKKDGGMETYTLQLTEALIPFLDSKPIIFTRKIEASEKLLKKVNIYKVNVSWLPRVFKELYFSWKVKKLKKKLGIDILIGCCRCSGVDIVMCGGTHKGFLLTKNNRTLFDKISERIEEKQNEEAVKIIAHSIQMKNELENLYGVPEEKISVFYPPVSTERFHPVSDHQKKEIREKLGLSLDKLYFLFVSSSHKRKGLPLLAEFFSTTNLPITLLVVGKKLDQPIRNVEYFGYSNKIEELYQAADFSVLASNYEPFGLAAVESVASGIPIIISDKVGSNEIINERHKYVFEADNLESLRGQIDKALAERASSTNEEEVPKFSYDLSVSNHAQKVFQVIKSVYTERKNGA